MINNIVDTVLSTYDLSLDNNERRNKFEVLNNYQQNIFSLGDLEVLLNQNSTQQVKIFGFQCLENLILYKWNSADKNQAKLYLIEIIREYGNLMLDSSSERVVRWIIAKTVFYFIRHECPQNCDTIIDDLIALKINGKMTKALILSILFCLSETLPNDNKMPEKRKKEVISYVTDRSQNMIYFCIEVLQKDYKNKNVDDINLSIEAAKTIQSLSSWIKYETLISMANMIMTVVINNLIVDSSDYYLLDILETILERKVRIDERYGLLSTIFKEFSLWKTFVSNISTAFNIPINPYSDEKFRYLQKIFDLLLIIGNLVVSNWQNFLKEVSPSIINELIDLILMATHHPIKILSVEFLSFWSNAFKTEQESLRNLLVSKAQSLLPLLKSLSIKQNVRNPSNIDHEYLTSLIEETEAEAYVTRIRVEISKTVNVLIQHFASDIIALTLEWLLSLINGVKEIENRNAECLRVLSHDCQLMKELEACRYFTKCVMHGIFRPYSKNLREDVKNMSAICSSDIISRNTEIISLILIYKDINPYISCIYLDVLSLILPFGAGQECLIEKCLEKIFMWFGKIETCDTASPDYVPMRQLQLDCGVWLLRIFRDYSFLIPTNLFERMLAYHQSICSPIYSRPNIIESFVLYICHSGNYSIERKKQLLEPFIESIRAVICSEQVLRIFQNGGSVVRYLQMNMPKPTEAQGPNYPSLDHISFRNSLSQSITVLLGLCRRMSADQTDADNMGLSKTTAETTPCQMIDSIMPMLPSLLVVVRALNQIWSSREINADFQSLREISAHYRDSLIKNQSGVEKFGVNCGQQQGDIYVFHCRNFLSKLHESVWTILSKFCSNFSRELYSMREWPLGVIEYVFADLGSLPNFKLMSLIKSFLIPFVASCPSDLACDVLVPTIVPFTNYLFQKLGEQWALVENNVCPNDVDNEYEMDNNTSEDNKDLSNEIIEEQILRIVSKTFINLFKLTMTIGSTPIDDSSKPQVLGILTNALCKAPPNGEYPIIMVFMNHICHAITWKDSYCCSKLCLLLQPFIREIHTNGLLTIDIIIFVLRQTINALNIFASTSYADIRLIIMNLAIYLYDEHLSKEPSYMERFIQLFDKSSSKAIHTFQHKMMPNNSAKVKREAFQNMLQPYIGVPTNQMFSHDVLIKNLPPLMKTVWNSRQQRRLSLDSNEVLSLSNLFDE